MNNILELFKILKYILQVKWLSCEVIMGIVVLHINEIRSFTRGEVVC